MMRKVPSVFQSRRSARDKSSTQNDSYTEQTLTTYALHLLKVFSRRAVPQEILQLGMNRLDTPAKARIVLSALESLPTGRPGEQATRDLDTVRGTLGRVARRVALGEDDAVEPLFRDVFTEEFPDLIPRIGRELRGELEARRRDLERHMRRERSTFMQRLGTLRRAFALNDLETRILELHHHFLNQPDLKSALSLDSLAMDYVLKSVRTYSLFFRVKPRDLVRALQKESTLVRAGLIERPKRDRQLDLPDVVSEFLLGVGSPNLAERYFPNSSGGPGGRKGRSTPLKLADYPLPAANLAVMKNLLGSKGPGSLLAYGPPGTGKTEFAVALASECGLKAVWLTQSDEDGDESLSHRKSGLVAAQNLLDPDRTLLVVDECDPILNTRSESAFGCDDRRKGDEKGWLNDYLDTSKLKILWISNRVGGIDDSTKRRFSYAQEFPALARLQREKAWRIQRRVCRASYLSDEKLADLSRRFAVSPGIISQTLRDSRRMGSRLTPVERIRALENILEAQVRLAGQPASGLAPLHARYSLAGVNTDADLAQVRDLVSRFLAERPADVANLNVLLLGPPGTGKTEFAKHLAEHAGRELLVRRASDLVSMWVGETEKEIARTFRSASDSGSILFIDEADSLFIDRESASRSWEVSQTNELLTQMENFRGVLLCATNLAGRVDSAAMRRFAHKIRFDYLTGEGASLFFERTLRSLCQTAPSEQELRRLHAIPRLAPGDFKVVHQRHRLLGGASSSVLPSVLIDDLEKESRFRRALAPKQVLGLGLGG